MKAWKASPYAAIGIYIGGVQRACPDGNLSASWVSTVAARGWGFLPLYVGLQSPCVNVSSLAKFSLNPTSAEQQGRQAAVDAVAQAQRLGLTPGATLYYDMEAYAEGNTECSTAVKSFLTGWGAGFRETNYSWSVYGNDSPLMADVAAMRQAGLSTPNRVWVARWDGNQNVLAGLPNTPCGAQTCVKQYLGNIVETWGGVKMNIDANYVDSTVTGNPVQANYGASTVGPGSPAFRFTGPMTGWLPMPGVGQKGMAYYTMTKSGARQVSSATWVIRLTPGAYAMDAWIPGTNNGGMATYQWPDDRTGVQNSGYSRVDQRGAAGYRRVGVISVLTERLVPVELLDSDSYGGYPVIADALRFTPTTAPPEPPLGVQA